MERKTIIWGGMIIGATIGGYLPLLWGGDLLSFSAIFFSGVGGIAGIWIAYRISS